MIDKERGKILVIHGPNLGLLGQRQVDIYGNLSLDEINGRLKQLAKERGVELDVFQSDREGEIVERIGTTKGKVDALLINPAAYTHTSVAIRDAIEGYAACHAQVGRARVLMQVFGQVEYHILQALLNAGCDIQIMLLRHLGGSSRGSKNLY